MTNQDQPSDYSTCRECGEDYDTSDLNDSMVCYVCDHICVGCDTPCATACLRDHKRVECPQHEGNFDCNPFCRLCEGNQEFCPTCDKTALCVDCRVPLVGDKWHYSHENEMGSRVCPKCYGENDHQHEWDTTTERTHCLGCEAVE